MGTSFSFLKVLIMMSYSLLTHDDQILSSLKCDGRYDLIILIDEISI